MGGKNEEEKRLRNREQWRRVNEAFDQYVLMIIYSANLIPFEDFLFQRCFRLY